MGKSAGPTCGAFLFGESSDHLLHGQDNAGYKHNADGGHLVVSPLFMGENIFQQMAALGVGFRLRIDDLEQDGLSTSAICMLGGLALDQAGRDPQDWPCHTHRRFSRNRCRSGCALDVP